MSKKIKVLVKEPGQAPQIKVIENELEEFQKIVGGYIEVVGYDPEVPDVLIICNEEGKIKELDLNFFTLYDCIVGTAVFVASGEYANFESLAGYQIARIGELLW